MTIAPGTKLGPYEILAPIGAGGMGEVWKARDTRLGRIVAIKKVKEQHSERFKREARSIAALNHPNICQLFDIGPDYLVLEYVEGKPLSSPLPEKEAVRLAIQIAAALEEAHRNGIIHRDLKPSNIMVTNKGSVKLLDFGLAKLYEQDASISSSPTADYPATQAGAVLGTVAYMSPEQAQGQPADARSDIFSFGLVLYEMLSGRRAFSGDNSLAILAAIQKSSPLPVQASPSLEKIVRRCLAKQPSGRYQTVSEIKTALEQVSGEMASKISSKPQPSIAVLPFVNMSGDKEQEYFSDGLAEEIINALTQIRGLKVSARTSSFSFRGKEADIPEIRDKLKVENILEGSVRRSGNRIRITVQLIDAVNGYHLWSQRYDREMADVFAVQDEISQAVAEKLRIELAAGPRFVKRRTKNVEAYNLYLKGRYQLFKFTPDSFAKGKENFEQAIAADPNYALAWFGLAYLYFYGSSGGFMPAKEANSLCGHAALKALELDETLPEAHSMIAALRASEYDWKGAESEFQRALELDPESWEVLAQYSYFYLFPMRRTQDAVATWREVVERDPLSAFLQVRLGLAYYLTRQWDRAIEQVHKGLELDPHFFLAHTLLCFIYIQTGKLNEALQAAETAAQVSQRTPVSLGTLGCAYVHAGRIDEAQRLLEELQKTSQKTHVSATHFAQIYFALGEIDKCFDCLDKAVDEHDVQFFTWLDIPYVDPLRSHPRYHALLRKMNLEV